jgi:hypothetical protein
MFCQHIEGWIIIFVSALLSGFIIQIAKSRKLFKKKG